MRTVPPNGNTRTQMVGVHGIPRDAYVWILVIEIFGDRVEGILTESACLALVQEVQSPKTIAYCYEDGTPDPEWWGWRRPRVKDRPFCSECQPPKGIRWG